MEKLDQDRSPVVNRESVSKGRRRLLKAGWAVPVIAATPLLNTAVALSANDCPDLYGQMDAARAAGDKTLYQSIKRRAQEAGCDLSNY